jgi:hypothetical protein
MSNEPWLNGGHFNDKTFIVGSSISIQSIHHIYNISSGNTIKCLLLYTNEDKKLSSFVQDNFDSLHSMTGKDILLCFCEDYIDGHYIDNLIVKINKFFSHIRYFFTKNKNIPYDKSQSYEFAAALGINFDNIPCMIVFQKDIPRVIFSIKNDDFTHFFRSIIWHIRKEISRYRSQEIDENILYENISLFYGHESIVDNLNKFVYSDENIYSIKVNYLRALEKQIAHFGLYCPAYITIERDNLIKEIENYQALEVHQKK